MILIASARTAAERLNNSSDKRIADILMNQEPQRYITPCGSRNWLVLNKDVALLQRHLKGTIPTRTNFMSLLHTVVRKTEARSASSSTQTRRDTDHRMAPQKRVLEEEYSIKFTVKQLRRDTGNDVSDSPSCITFLHGQEKNDFHIALKRQQQEIESSNSTGTTGFDVYKESPASEQQDEVADPLRETVDVTVKTDNELEQFEAGAVAALLRLKNKKQ